MPRKSAAAISAFLKRYVVPQVEAGELPLTLKAGLVGFASKLQRAAARKSSDPLHIRLWSLSRQELMAGRRFAFILYFQELAKEEPADSQMLELRNACEDLLIELIRVRGKGRPRLKVSEAEELEREYWAEPSAFRGDVVGGSHLRRARARVRAVGTVMSELAANFPADYNAAIADVGTDLLKNAVAIHLDTLETLKAEARQNLKELPEYQS